MTTNAPRRRKAVERAKLIRLAEDASYLAAFSWFAADVAEQRHDMVRAIAYRKQAAQCRREMAQLLLAAERCRPWWTRPRRALRGWSRGLFGTWSWRADDPGVTP